MKIQEKPSFIEKKIFAYLYHWEIGCYKKLTLQNVKMNIIGTR